MSQETIAREAARWWLDAHDGDRDENAFEQWCRADPRHAAQYLHLQELWQAGAATPSLQRQQQRRQRRRLREAGIAVLLLCALGLYSRHASPPVAQVLRTAAGEIREETLPDGSHVLLSPGSEVKVRIDGQRRQLQLQRGQAWFQVAHEARPFQVEAAGGQIRDIGTAFSVSMQDTTVLTQVSEGGVDVRPGDGSVQRLHAGQARVFRDGRWLQPVQLEDTATMAPWRRGEVVIDDQPAAQAIADLARYRRAPVWVLGGQGASVRVSGLFHLQQSETAINAVAAQAGLRVQRLPGGALVVW
ncbi:MAG TPA: histidine kinase [Pseudomonas sp.]|nr:histidine kinase [Pseudomonas sp.]